MAFRALPPGGAPPAHTFVAPPVAAHNIPPGTLPPGTIVNVGKFRVTVDRYLSEGGFAHVYLASSATPIPEGSPVATTRHVLKRMAVPDQAGVEEVGKEVKVMKLLRDHPRIVNIVEASVAELPAGGYEIYILMEWCPGGGIIDMMNTRLQNRMTEQEVLKIFSDTVEAVAHMHYQNPPLLHRDLKVENILLSPPHSYKLCDFGSTTVPLRVVPTAVAEIQAIEAEINRTTTLQYRAPELVDVWSRKGYDEKIDIWALGVLLYKLCFYTTPFEEHGPLAILNAQYKMPPHPPYSSGVRSLIASMLQEKAPARPNIYQVHEQVCRLRGTQVTMPNKYAATSTAPSPAPPASRTPGFATNKPLPQPSTPSTGMDGIISTGPPQPQLALPDLASTISPMRRGRPAKSTGPAPPSGATTPAAELPTPSTAGVGGGGFEDSFNFGGKSMQTVGIFSELEEPAGGDKAGAKPASGDEWKVPGSAAGAGAGGAAGFDDDADFASKYPSLDVLAASPTPVSPGVPGAGGFSSLAGNGLKPSSFPGASQSPGPMPAAGFSTATAHSTPAPAGPASGSWIPSAKSPSLPSNGYGSIPATFGAPLAPSASQPVPSDKAPAPQLTGENGPPLPRRPPQGKAMEATATQTAEIESPRPTVAQLSQNWGKPELVSRASQTSPRLMAAWRPPTSLAQAVGGGNATGGPRLTKPPQKDLLGDDDDDFAPGPAGGRSAMPLTVDPSAGPKALPGMAAAGGFRTGGSLASAVGGGPGSPAREKFRPVRGGSGATIGSPGGVGARFGGGGASPAPIAPKPGATEASERFPALDDFDAPPAVSAPAKVEAALAKAEPLPTPASLEKDTGAQDDSSDDEAGPEEVEDFAPRKRMSVLGGARSPLGQEAMKGVSPAPPNLLEEADSGDGGRVDLGPALNSIRKFAPGAAGSTPLATSPGALSPAASQGFGGFSPSVRSPAGSDFDPPSALRSTKSPPPILQPKPQSVKKQAAIDSLVEKYDGLTTRTPEPKAAEVQATGASTSAKPPPTAAAKPANLRKDSVGPEAAPAVVHATTGKSSYGVPETAPAAHATTGRASYGVAEKSRPLFKPTPPGVGGLRGPRPMGAAGAKEEGEEEEKFAGVKNMRARWERGAV